MSGPGAAIVRRPAAAVIDDAGRLLGIRRRDNNHWEPPGGVLELDETITEGLRREVKEETGLLVEPGPLTGVYKNMVAGIVALVFRCRPLDGIASPTAEAVELRWFDPDELDRYMDEAYAVRLTDALSDGPPAIRSHDGHLLLSRDGS